MIFQPFSIPEGDGKRILAAASPDAALLYIYIHSGNSYASAQGDLHLSESRLSCAAATLRQLGLWPQERVSPIAPGERPNYTEGDVVTAVNSDNDFKALYGEVQRLLGKTLNTEELKILLGFERYLGLPAEVVSVLVSYCKERARQRGSLRSPSLRTIEKEAYSWAENGIDTLEEASAYILAQNVRRSRISQVKDVVQIRGRNLTATEEKYAASWLDMGFSRELLAMAYDRTCTNTGNMNWAYMNKILLRWHEQGLHSVEAVRGGDKKPGKTASGEMGQAELDAIRQMLGEG